MDIKLTLQLSSSAKFKSHVQASIIAEVYLSKRLPPLAAVVCAVAVLKEGNSKEKQKHSLEFEVILIVRGLKFNC